MKDETLSPHLRHLITLPEKAAAEAETDLPSGSDEYQAFGGSGVSPTLRSISSSRRPHVELSVRAS